MAYLRKSVLRAPGNPGMNFKPRDLLVLLNIDDIAFMPAPDENGVVIADDIVMKPGRYGIEMYMTSGTPALTSAAEGDTDKVGFTPSLEFEHPGNEQEVREFKVNEINSRFIGIMRYCSGKPADLIGSICNPCKITPSYEGNSEGNTNKFTLAQTSKGDDIFIYKGSIPLEEPVAVIEGSATEVPFISEGRYQLSAGASEITEVTGGAHDAVISLMGCAGASPIVQNVPGKIMLRGGKNFTATDGSILTLRAFDNGGENPVWIEQSRYINP